jgi:hypothetical protein
MLILRRKFEARGGGVVLQRSASPQRSQAVYALVHRYAAPGDPGAAPRRGGRERPDLAAPQCCADRRGACLYSQHGSEAVSGLRIDQLCQGVDLRLWLVVRRRCNAVDVPSSQTVTRCSRARGCRAAPRRLGRRVPESRHSGKPGVRRRRRRDVCRTDLDDRPGSEGHFATPVSDRTLR